MRIKRTNAHENIAQNDYIIIAVSLLRFSVTFCGHRQGGVFSNDILQRQPDQCTDIKY
jgi:hypothetical protein